MNLDTFTNQTVIDANDGINCFGSVVLSPWGDGYYLYKLYVATKYRRNGVAKALVGKAIEYADGKPIYLAPASYGDGEMSNEQLTAWYARMGFEQTESDSTIMVRR